MCRAIRVTSATLFVLAGRRCMTTRRAVSTLARRQRATEPSHRCEVQGRHKAVAAAGYFVCTSHFGERVFLWGCEECRDWWQSRHPDDRWIVFG